MSGSRQAKKVKRLQSKSPAHYYYLIVFKLTNLYLVPERAGEKLEGEGVRIAGSQSNSQTFLSNLLIILHYRKTSVQRTREDIAAEEAGLLPTNQSM